MIVGLGYKKRRGKDTAANALVRDLGFTKLSFADALKSLALKANPLVVSTPPNINVQIGAGRLEWMVRREGWERAKDSVEEVRRFVADLGVGCREVLGEDVWTNIVMFQVEAQPDKDFVIADVRFPNEAQRILDLGGRLVRVDRTPYPPIQEFGHVSETALDDWEDWDLVLDNNASIPQLEAEIVAWVRAQRQKAA